MKQTYQPALGDRVRIIEADLDAIIVSHTEFLDGTHRWECDYWNEGLRKTVNCAEWEIRLIAHNAHMLQGSDGPR